MPEIILKPGREKSILKRHPWIFSGAIASVTGSPKPGETVDVISANGEFLARAAYNPGSNIAGRIWTWDQAEPIAASFFERRLLGALERRRKISHLIPSNAMRIVHGESDGVPGLILDKYNETFVAQFLTAGVEYWKPVLVELIHTHLSAGVIYERSDVDVRQLEGLADIKSLLYGTGFQQPETIVEHGANFYVDIIEGHKTGFYLDQRDNRRFARDLSEGRRVLDCFSYTGGFAVNCMLGKAKQVTLVESSSTALDLARKNMVANNLDLDKAVFIEQDVFKYLRLLRDRGESYDLIILDPPKFAPTAAQVERASRAYKDINLLALKLLEKGGYLLTFSCSGGVSEDLFHKIVAGAAQDAGIEAVILKHLYQAPDHPVGLNFPEGAYLKGFLIQKVA